ncbi:hypothetical protein H4R35_001372 [Dimargaris xerosporica]|nr:hypothetical protein H4R35_001372 [Dimargaris xerosporica]
MTDDFSPLWRHFQPAAQTVAPSNFIPVTLDDTRKQFIRAEPWSVALMRDFFREYGDFVENQYGPHLLCGEDLIAMMRKGQIVYLYYVKSMEMAIQSEVLYDPLQPSNLMDKTLKKLQPLGFAMMRGYDMTEAGNEELAIDLEATVAMVGDRLVRAFQCYMASDQPSINLKHMHDLADAVEQPHRLGVCDAAVARQIQQRKLYQLPLRTIQYVRMVNDYGLEMDLALLHGIKRQFVPYNYESVQGYFWERYTQAMVHVAAHQAELVLYYRQAHSDMFELITLYHPRRPTLDGEAKIKQLTNLAAVYLSSYNFALRGRVTCLLDLKAAAASTSGKGGVAMSPSVKNKWGELAYIRHLYDTVVGTSVEDSDGSEWEEEVPPRKKRAQRVKSNNHPFPSASGLAATNVKSRVKKRPGKQTSASNRR